MRRLTILGAVLASVLIPAAGVVSSSSAGTTSVASAPQLVAFRGFHLGGGGGGFGRRRFGFAGSGRRGSSHILRRVGHALAFAYLLHLFFSHGGLSILVWLLVIGFIVHRLRRRRSRRQYA